MSREPRNPPHTLLGMSTMDAAGNFHDHGNGQFTGHAQGEGDTTVLGGASVPASPMQLFDSLDAPTRMRLRTGSVTLPAGMLAQVARAIRVEGFAAAAPHEEDLRALDYAQFAWEHRDLVGVVPGWGTEQYLEMTRPWRQHVGEVHPDDADGRPWYDDVLGQIPDEDDITAQERWDEATAAAQAAAIGQLEGYLPEGLEPPY